MADWFIDLAEEESDAAHLAEFAKMPEEARIGTELRPYVAAFSRLSADRPQRMMIMTAPMGGAAVTYIAEAIPFSAINAYAERYVIRGDDFFVFQRLIEIMDDEYRKVMAEQQNTSTSDG